MDEIRMDLDSYEDYRQKFEMWKASYPDVKKRKIIQENGNSRSKVNKVLHSIFKEEVWNDYANRMRELRYAEKKKEIMDEIRMDLDSHADYDQKFKKWKASYPDVKKRKIIQENKNNWSKVYKVLNSIFKEEVWNDYADRMRELRYAEEKKEKSLKEHGRDQVTEH